ncbi:serine/threonine-protein phosphatase 4 catalytic subunit [Nematocida homosporus]|uniref:serine/threonine-protein phosphatase 4 catalytic subunit n=1 Tax=Nematocida homosporus TaxID=1912981 RepID=UPI002220AA56|nr:serine/threonine-protein phosphatase 4 catalytic subunit [Nematocida homosporus]KAI5185860.1 serine/threonine-protein phosphatase 4 catalytic subunit [Nematocida homosporus]
MSVTRSLTNRIDKDVVMSWVGQEELLEYVERLKIGGIDAKEVFELCQRAMGILAQESSLLVLNAEVLIVGDIHGQFFDLLEILGIEGVDQYLFLGDYVDRGANSLETILVLLYMKVRWPDKVWLLRGNHESKRLSLAYGFYEECIRAYGSPVVWEMICEVFDYLPLAAVIDQETFAVHGGIGPSTSLDKILGIDRVGDVPLSGVVTELLWSDPDEGVLEFTANSRGAGYLFGAEQVAQFLQESGLKRIIRSHQLVEQGYNEMFGGQVVTVWSAPNYCYRCMNKATVIKLGRDGSIEYIEVPMAENQRGKPKPSLYFL